MSWTIVYYSEAVQNEIRAWPPGLRARFVRVRDLMVDEGPDLEMPHTRAMGKGLFEIRCRSHEGFGRVFLGTRPGRKIVMLHAFLKKTARTPPRELAVAYRRLREVISGEA